MLKRWISQKLHSLIVVCSWFVGYGGGFNEREGVEYIQRQDSDDEFDEVTLDLLNLLKGFLAGACRN